MKINEILDSDEEIDEALVPMVNWFKTKYKDMIAQSDKKHGQGEIQKMNNDNLRAFMRHMGRYNVDWDTLNFYVVYVFMRQTLDLEDNDVKEIINNAIIKDPNVKLKKRLSIQQIANRRKPLEISQLFAGSANPVANAEQIFGQKIIIDASMRRLERYWEQKTGTSTVDRGVVKRNVSQASDSQNSSTSKTTVDTDIENAVSSILANMTKDELLKRLNVVATQAAARKSAQSGIQSATTGKKKAKPATP